MAELVRQSDEGSTDLSDLVCCINAAVENLVRLGSQSIDDGREWEVLRCCPRVSMDKIDEACLAELRKEFLRVIGGLEMRIISTYRSEFVRFLMATELCSYHDPPLPDDMAEWNQARLDLTRVRECCMPAEHHTLRTDPPGYEDARRLKRVWLAGMMANERAHSGNRKRQGAKQGTTRTWRRQVANHIVACSKADYAGRSTANKQKLRMLSTLSFKEFEAALDPPSSRTACINHYLLTATLIMMYHGIIALSHYD